MNAAMSWSIQLSHGHRLNLTLSHSYLLRRSTVDRDGLQTSDEAACCRTTTVSLQTYCSSGT